MIRFAFLLVFLFATLLASAQLHVSFTSGYANYAMKDLKHFQQELKEDFRLDPRITASFPAYWFYDLNIFTVLGNNLIVGGSFAYSSTGGRIHYSDFSGEIGSDQFARFFALSSTIGMAHTFNNETWKLLADLRPGLVYTEFDFNVYQRIGSSRDSETLKFTSTSLCVQPTLTLQKSLGRFGIHATIGYHFTALPGNLYSKDYDEAYLIDNNEKEIRADWSGLRLGAGVHFVFKRKKSSEPAPRNVSAYPWLTD